MTKCIDCKHYHFEWVSYGFADEWCKKNNVYLHDDDCPNYEKELKQ